MEDQSQNLTPQSQNSILSQGHDHGPRSGHELLSWIVIIIVSVVGAYFLNGYVSRLSEKGLEPPPVVNESAIDNSQSTIDTAGWQTYRNERYGFEFKYPANWNIYGATPASTIITLELNDNNDTDWKKIKRISITKEGEYENLQRYFDKYGIYPKDKSIISDHDFIFYIRDSVTEVAFVQD